MTQYSVPFEIYYVIQPHSDQLPTNHFASFSTKFFFSGYLDYSMIYILVGSFAMVISVAGLMWSVCLCVTR